MDNLERLRNEIDQLDSELLTLLNRRLELVGKIGALKKSVGLPVRDPTRELEILHGLTQRNPGPMDDESIFSVFREVLAIARRHQGESASQQGTEGAVSDFRTPE